MNVRACPLLPSSVLVAMLAAVFATLLPLSALSAPPRYTAARLGTLGGTYSGSTGINDRGDVVGFSHLAGNAVFHGFVHASGTLIDIGVVGDGTCSRANGVNDAKQVVGYSDFACEANYRPTIYADGTHTYLFVDLVFGEAKSINASGQITGYIRTIGGNRAFSLSAGSVTYPGTLGGRESFGYGLNDRGDIVGESTTMLPTSTNVDGPKHAFLYASGTMRDLGTLGGNNSVAFAINNSGQVTGGSTTFGDRESHAFVYTAGVMSDLGTLGGAVSEGRGINDAGWVVGWSSTSSGSQRAFLFVDGSMYDLNELLVSDLGGDEIAVAGSINSHGQIAATACSPTRGCVPVRLDPVADQRTAEVPVLSPAMLGAIAIALGSAGAWRFRRKRAR